MTKQKLTAVRTKVLTAVEEGLETGLFTLGALGQWNGRNLCLLQAIVAHAHGGPVGWYRDTAARVLGITHDQAEVLEAGFEGWEQFRTPARKALYDLGAGVRRTYAELAG